MSKLPDVLSPIPSPTRRRLLAALGISSLVGAAPIELRGADDQSEYLFAPGLTYLNTAALGPTTRAVLERTLEAWRELESNPVYMGYSDGPAHVAADRVRSAAANLLGCTADEILLTRSTTEAMTDLAHSVPLRRGDRVLITDQEHNGGIVGWQYRARRDGVLVDVVPIAPTDHDPGAIVQRFAAAITRRTKVISVSHVLFATGLRMPIAELAALARSRGIFCVVDGAQAVGQIEVDVKALGCHAYATAGHKWLMGPKGTGLLYVSRDATGIELVQWELGKAFITEASGVGSHPLASGLVVAIEAMAARGLAAVERHNLALRERAYEGFAQLPQLTLMSVPRGPLATAIVSARLPADIDARALITTLREKHRVVIKRIEESLFNGIRFSPHIFNTEADVDAALAALRTELA